MKKDKISYRGIQNESIYILKQRTKSDYYSELKHTLDTINSLLREYRIITAGDTDDVELELETICSEFNKSAKNLLRFVDYYLRGQISSCYNAFYKWWKVYKLEKYNETYSQSIFYRMRNREEDNQIMNSAELLHIPFELRGKITNQRYSVTGFPCLYLSASLYQAWEELRRPNIMNIYAVAIKFVEHIRLWDFRLVRTIKTKHELKCYLQRLPLIIANSLIVKNDNDTFKPEYIIPQILLHSVIKEKTDGIIYTSLRKDFAFYNAKQWDFTKNENIAIPVKSSQNEGLCKKLLSQIDVSDALNVEHEMIRGTIKFEKDNKYNNTVLGQLENQLNVSWPPFTVNSKTGKIKGNAHCPTLL